MKKIEKIAALVLKFSISPHDSWALVKQLRQLVVDGNAVFRYYPGSRWDSEKEKDFTNSESTCTYQECLHAELRKVDGDMATFRITVNDGTLAYGEPTGEIRRKFEVVAPLAICTEIHSAIMRRFNLHVIDVYETRQNEIMRKQLEKISSEILKSL
jgi:hypothetical protein